MFYYRIQKFKILSLVFTFWFFVFGSAEAAVLYLEPAEGSYYQNDTFILEARIGAEECVNAAAVELSFPADLFSAVDFSQGNSILTIWVQPPQIDNDLGTISFSGGIPGGYCGILPGDPGESNLLGRVIFRVKSISDAMDVKITFSSTSQVLLNDGAGTSDILYFSGALISLFPQAGTSEKREWQEELEKDDIPPELFNLEINRDDSIFGGRYFISFNAVDKQTGIDYYEMKEGNGDWKKSSSPVLLEDQELGAIIKVRAVDKAGNERIAEYAPKGNSLLRWIIAILSVLIILFVVKKYGGMQFKT